MHASITSPGPYLFPPTHFYLQNFIQPTNHPSKPILRKGLCISDVPLHDATRDLVLLSEQFEAEYKLTRNLEILTDKLQQTYRELESEKQKTDQLLYSVLPKSVANELRHQRPVNPKRYPSVTLMFSGIVGFSQYCAANTSAEGAMKIVKMLNELYTIFDSLTDSKSNSNVYKVNIVTRVGSYVTSSSLSS